MHVTLVLAGTTGAGHLTRALALVRAVERAGRPLRVSIVGPPNPWSAIRFPEWVARREIAFRPEEYTTPERARESALGTTLSALAPDVVLCDLHWVPVQQVLAAGISTPAWLLLRSHVPRWLDGPSFATFERELWERVFAIEPIGLPCAHQSLEPVVVGNPGERMPPDALHRHLGLTPGTPLTVAMQAGEVGEVEQLLGEPVGHLLQSDLRAEGVPYPLGLWLQGATRVLSGAGYNAFWEAKWLGHFERTRFTAFPRPIDDQAWRIRECAAYRMRENGADQLVRLLERG